MNKNFDTYLKHISQLADGSQKSFMSAYNKFPGIEDLIESNPDKERVYHVLQEWINDMNIHPASRKVYFSCIRQYLYYRGIELDTYGIRRNVKFPKLYVEELHPLARNEIVRIIEGSDSRHQLLYIAQLSSGMRIGEIVRIRRRHLHVDQERIMVKIPATLTKTRRGRTTFFSREVSQMLGRRLEGMEGSDLVFYNNEKQQAPQIVEAVYLNRLIKRIGLCEKYETNSRNKITTHSLRAFFITQISRHDPNLAKIFAGQLEYLLGYDRLTDEEKLEKYLEFEPDLIIRDYEQVRRENKRLKAQVAEGEELRRENDEMRLENREMMRRITRLEAMALKA